MYDVWARSYGLPSHMLFYASYLCYTSYIIYLFFLVIIYILSSWWIPTLPNCLFNFIIPLVLMEKCTCSWWFCMRKCNVQHPCFPHIFPFFFKKKKLPQKRRFGKQPSPADDAVACRRTVGALVALPIFRLWLDWIRPHGSCASTDASGSGLISCRFFGLMQESQA